MMAGVFNFFRRRRSGSQLAPPRAPGDTVRAEDRDALVTWASTRTGVEGFVEPETVLNEMSLVLVDAHGEFIRRHIGGPKGIDAMSKALGMPLFDVEATGYPDRMRQRIERERILRNRREAAERRRKFQSES